MGPTESGNDLRSSVQSAVPGSVQNAVPSSSPNFISEFEEMHVDAVPMSNMETASCSSANVAANSAEIHAGSASNVMPYMVSNFSHGMVSSVEELDPDVETLDRLGAVPNPPSDIAIDVDDIQMVDEIEHPLILSGDRESPFTYLASLSTKWAATKEKASSVQGKVKVQITGPTLDSPTFNLFTCKHRNTRQNDSGFKVHSFPKCGCNPLNEKRNLQNMEIKG